MHMADALITPVVGAAFWVAGAAALSWSSRKIRGEMDHARVPLMGVLGAFVFAAQMINFAIPGTGSSGHLGGGLLLAILLGPYAALVVMASILTVQALLFADGGVLALGCNIFNLGVIPCFIAYPLIYRPLAGGQFSSGRRMSAAVIACGVSLQLGALGVVAQTWFSGISDLPFRTFTLLMLPIHLPIGVVEGLVTAAVTGLVWNARPEVFETERAVNYALRPILVSFLVATVLVGGGLSLYASEKPDGLEWAVVKSEMSETLPAKSSIHRTCSDVQERAALLPDYAVPGSETSAGISVAGLIGGGTVFFVSILLAHLLKRSVK